MLNKKKLKITPQGYLVLAATAVLLIAIIVIICAVSCGSCSGDAGSDVGASTSPSIAPSVSPSNLPTSADPSVSPSADTTNQPSVTDTPAPSDNPQSSSSPTGTQTPDPNVLTEPTSVMKENAVSGKIAKDDVNMRQGPSTSHSIVASSLKNGSTVTVYTEVNGWYFLRVNAINKYGYIRKDLVSLDKALSGTTTPEATVPDGAIKGTVNVSSMVLRKTAELVDSNKDGNVVKGDIVFVYYKVKDKDGNTFYYVEVAASGKTGFLCAIPKGETSPWIKCSGTVPDKP